MRKSYPNNITYLQSKNLLTAEQLHTFVAAMSSNVHNLNASLREKSDKMKELKNLFRLARGRHPLETYR